MSKVTNKNGYILDFNVAVNYMDPDIVYQINDAMDIVPCSDQEFFSAYEELHEFVFGEEWELSKANPCW